LVEAAKLDVLQVLEKFLILTHVTYAVELLHEVDQAIFDALRVKSLFSFT
jgi:hypothetical protein